MEIIIDATNLIAGRMATHIAKQALMGHTIKIVNSEKAVMSGNVSKAIQVAKYKKFEKGVPKKGPFFSKLPDRYLRRLIRGMLPYKQPRGREAYENVMCYIGVPVDVDASKAITIKEANVSKLPDLKYIALGKLCEELGGKYYG